MRSVALILVGFLASLLGGRETSAAEAGAATESGRIEAGHGIYLRSCASCHGEKGEGVPDWRQPDRRGELPAPPHDRTGHTWKHSDAMLYRLVQDGWRDPFNKTARQTMPGFKGQLSHDDTIAVIAYLKTLWTPQQRRFQRNESARQPSPPEMR